MTLTFVTPQQAQEQLESSSNAFFSNFSKAFDRAIVFPGEEPRALWKANGEGYLASTLATARPHPAFPFLPRPLIPEVNVELLRTWNYQRFESALAQGRGREVAETLVPYKSALRLLALPEELPDFGPWLAAWVESQESQASSPPPPPHPLMPCGSEIEDFTLMGELWRSCREVQTVKGREALLATRTLPGPLCMGMFDPTAVRSLWFCDAPLDHGCRFIPAEANHPSQVLCRVLAVVALERVGDPLYKPDLKQSVENLAVSLSYWLGDLPYKEVVPLLEHLSEWAGENGLPEDLKVDFPLKDTRWWDWLSQRIDWKWIAATVLQEIEKYGNRRENRIIELKNNKPFEHYEGFWDRVSKGLAEY